MMPRPTGCTWSQPNTLRERNQAAAPGVPRVPVVLVVPAHNRAVPAHNQAVLVAPKVPVVPVVPVVLAALAVPAVRVALAVPAPSFQAASR